MGGLDGAALGMEGREMGSRDLGRWTHRFWVCLNLESGAEAELSMPPWFQGEWDMGIRT